MPDFTNHNTRVCLNAETYVKFDGSDKVMIQNVASEDAMHIKYDIMLLLYEMVDWITVADLIAPWPPDDQQKILHYLGLLYHSKIIVTAESEVYQPTASGISERVGSNIHINIHNHFNMLKDHVRMNAFRRGIEQVVTPQTVAMDLGAGTGVLSFFAAQAGAKKVFAIEKRPDIVSLGKQLAAANHYSAVEFVEANSGMLEPSSLSEQPNLIIAEILGNGILNESIIEYTLDARDRFLAPGGKLLPYQLDLYTFAFHMDESRAYKQEVAEFEDLYNIDFGLLGEVMERQVRTGYEHFIPGAHQAMSEPVMVKSINFYTQNATVFSQPFEIIASEDGVITGFCSYFKVMLTETTSLSNSPWAPRTHWTQLFSHLSRPQAVKAGDVIPLEMIYDGNLRIRKA